MIKDFENCRDRMGLADNLDYDDLDITGGRCNTYIVYEGDRLATVREIAASQINENDFTTILSVVPHPFCIAPHADFTS